MGLRIFIVHPSVLLTDHRPHGDGLVAHGFLRELAARGHTIHVAAQGVDLQEPLPSNVHIHRIDTGGAFPRDRLAFMLRMRRLYRRLASSTTFDLAHQMNPVDVGLSLAIADMPVPLVLGPYVPEWPGFPKPGGPLLRPLAVGLNRIVRAAQQRAADTVLLSTPAAASRLATHAHGRLRIREVPPGIDPLAWPATSEGDGNAVLFLANVEVRKGIHILLDAFALLAPELPEARLLVAGKGPELAPVRDRVRSSPRLERAEVLGHVERDRVMALMQQCAIYCLPSLSEPFGMTALEAMACARPVVATDAGGLRHLVTDSGGLRVPPGDAPRLASALRELLTDPARRQAMGAYNRELVEGRYAWPRVVDRLEEAYRETVRGAR